MNHTKDQLQKLQPLPENTVPAKKAWRAPSIISLSSEDTEAKVSSPGENGIVTGPS